MYTESYPADLSYAMQEYTKREHIHTPQLSTLVHHMFYPTRCVLILLHTFVNFSMLKHPTHLKSQTCLSILFQKYQAVHTRVKL